MPLMGSLYIGASGLQTGQNALNTTAHNLTNADTEGYVRQQVQQSAKVYITISKNPASISNQVYGLGVTYSRVKQVRDRFLDQTFRRESGRSMFYEVSTETLEHVQDLLGEMNGKTFQSTMTDLWTAVQELAKNPSSSVNQGLLVQRAEEFIERAVNVYDDLASYQDNLNNQVKQQVKKINEYGRQILELNDRIRAIEAGGVEQANDLKDTRNRIMDELSKLAKCTFTESAFGDVYVQIEGEDFVKGASCYEIALYTDPNTGFHTPFWPQNATYTVLENGDKQYNIKGAEVFDLTRTISSDYNTDIGGLKAMLLARGDHRADYTDIENNYDDISQSILMNMQAEFDQMVHSIATKMNEILANAAGVQTGNLDILDSNGNTVTLENVRFCESDSNGYMRKEDGSPIQLFDKVTGYGYEKVTGADGKEYWVYQEEDPSYQDTLYTLKNLQVDQDLKKSPSLMGFLKDDEEVDQATADALKEAFTEESYKLNPNVNNSTTFLDYYGDMVAQVANSGMVYRNIYEDQLNEVEATENAREQIMGVSSDEELSNMIKYQNAFNAASRYVNVVSEMLAHIINTLGV